MNQFLNSHPKKAVFGFTPLMQKFVDTMISNPDVPDEKANAFADMIRCLRPRNPITGFLSGESWKMDLREALRQVKKLKDDDSYETMVVRVSGDVSNLRTLNTALNGGHVNGRDANHEPSPESDKLLSIIANTFENGLHAASEALDPTLTHNCFCYQDGGDEFGAVLVLRKKKGTPGTIKDVLQKYLHEIEADTYQISVDLGLQDLVHKKYPNKPERRGVGIALSFSEIGPLTNLDKLEARLEQVIDKRKNMSPEEKWQQLDSHFNAVRDGGDIWIDRSSKRYGVRDGLVYENGLVVEVMPERLSVMKEHIERMHTELLSDSLEKISGFPFADVDVPESEKKKAGWAWVNPAYKRAKQLEYTMDALSFSQDERGFMQSLYNLYEENRTREGILSDPPAVVVDHYLDVRKHMKSKRVFAMALEVQNFTGLNRKFGHAGCNQIVDSLIQPIREALGENGKDAMLIRPENKGSMFYLILPDMEAHDIIRAVNRINEDFRSYEEFLDISHLPNERHPYNTALSGLKLACSAIQIDRNAINNPKAIIGSLHRQIESMKKQDGHEPLPEPGQLAAMLARARKEGYFGRDT